MSRRRRLRCVAGWLPLPARAGSLGLAGRKPCPRCVGPGSAGGRSPCPTGAGRDGAASRRQSLGCVGPGGTIGRSPCPTGAGRGGAAGRSPLPAGVGAAGCSPPRAGVGCGDAACPSPLLGVQAGACPGVSVPRRPRRAGGHCAPLRHDASRRPAGEPAQRPRAFHPDPHQLTSVLRIRPGQHLLRLQRHPVRHQPRPRRQARVQHARRRHPAADEHRVRRRQRAQRVRCVARHHLQLRDAQVQGVPADPLRPRRVTLDRDRAVQPVQPRPLDTDAARPRADVPQQLAGARREPGECRHPQVALGQLAVVGVHVVRDADQGQRGTRAREREDRQRAGFAGPAVGDALAGPAQVLQREQLALAVTRAPSAGSATPPRPRPAPAPAAPGRAPGRRGPTTGRRESPPRSPRRTSPAAPGPASPTRPRAAPRPRTHAPPVWCRPPTRTDHRWPGRRSAALRARRSARRAPAATATAMAPPRPPPAGSPAAAAHPARRRPRAPGPGPVRRAPTSRRPRCPPPSAARGRPLGSGRWT